MARTWRSHTSLMFGNPSTWWCSSRASIGSTFLSGQQILGCSLFFSRQRYVHIFSLKFGVRVTTDIRRRMMAVPYFIVVQELWLNLCNTCNFDCTAISARISTCAAGFFELGPEILTRGLERSHQDATGKIPFFFWTVMANFQNSGPDSKHSAGRGHIASPGRIGRISL